MDHNPERSLSSLAVLALALVVIASFVVVYAFTSHKQSVGDTTSANQVVVSGNQIALYPIVANQPPVVETPVGSDGTTRFTINSGNNNDLLLVNGGTGTFGLGVSTSTVASSTAVDGWGYLRVQLNATSTNCESDTSGVMFYNVSNAHEWGCNGTTWTKIF